MFHAEQCESKEHGYGIAQRNEPLGVHGPADQVTQTRQGRRYLLVNLAQPRLAQLPEAAPQPWKIDADEEAQQKGGRQVGRDVEERGNDPFNASPAVATEVV